jgi:hypothetical protein
MSFRDTNRPANPRYEAGPVHYVDLSDPHAWVSGRGGGGHGGGHGGHGHGGFGPGFVYADPWYADPYPWPVDDNTDPYAVPRRRHVVGAFDTGMGGLLVMGIIWLAYEAANKRVR